MTVKEEIRLLALEIQSLKLSVIIHKSHEGRHNQLDAEQLQARVAWTERATKAVPMDKRSLDWTRKYTSSSIILVMVNPEIPVPKVRPETKRETCGSREYFFLLFLFYPTHQNHSPDASKVSLYIRLTIPPLHTQPGVLLWPPQNA